MGNKLDLCKTEPLFRIIGAEQDGHNWLSNLIFSETATTPSLHHVFGPVGGSKI
jgi:hypothetical protein